MITREHKLLAAADRLCGWKVSAIAAGISPRFADHLDAIVSLSERAGVDLKSAARTECAFADAALDWRRLYFTRNLTFHLSGIVPPGGQKLHDWLTTCLADGAAEQETTL